MPPFIPVVSNGRSSDEESDWELLCFCCKARADKSIEGNNIFCSPSDRVGKEGLLSRFQGLPLLHI